MTRGCLRLWSRFSPRQVSYTINMYRACVLTCCLFISHILSLRMLSGVPP